MFVTDKVFLVLLAYSIILLLRLKPESSFCDLPKEPECFNCSFILGVSISYFVLRFLWWFFIDFLLKILPKAGV